MSDEIKYEGRKETKKIDEFIKRQGIVSSELCILLDNLDRVLNDKDQDLDILRKENSYLRASINRLYSEVSNGEHLDKEWIRDTLRMIPRDFLIDALNSKVARLEKEIKALKGQSNE